METSAVTVQPFILDLIVFAKALIIPSMLAAFVGMLGAWGPHLLNTIKREDFFAVELKAGQ